MADKDGVALATRTSRLTGWGAAAAAIGVVLPLAATTAVEYPGWSLRWALLPAIAGIGVPALIGLAASPGPVRRAARWALQWLAWAALAALLSPQRTLALWGQYQVGTGLVFLGALAGAWAVGVRAGERSSRLVADALLVGCLVNAALAVAEQLVNLGAYGVSTLDGRSAGLFGNPVYLAELLCGGLWLALSRLERRAAPVAAVLVIAAGIELSGSRAALGLAVLAVVVAVVRAPRHTRVLLVAAVAGGLALGAVVAAVAPGATTASDRVSGVAVASDGIRPRAETWKGGLAALADRPLWGWGPGAFLAAAGPHRTSAVARTEGPDVMFADAHDAVVESAVTTGIVGLGLLLVWLAAAVGLVRRRAHGLLGFAALVLGVTMLEPLHPGVTPLALLALGAAGAGGEVPSTTARWARGLTAATVVAGMAVSAWFVTGLAALRSADLAGSPAAAEAAARRLPPWGHTDAVIGTLVAFRGISRDDPAEMAAALRWWSAAARRDPADPAPWNDLAAALSRSGDPTGAAAAYRRALADNPWSRRALLGLVRLGPAGGVTTPEIARAQARLAALG